MTLLALVQSSSRNYMPINLFYSANISASFLWDGKNSFIREQRKFGEKSYFANDSSTILTINSTTFLLVQKTIKIFRILTLKSKILVWKMFKNCLPQTRRPSHAPYPLPLLQCTRMKSVNEGKHVFTPNTLSVLFILYTT